jgi:hypothetical protein
MSASHVREGQEALKNITVVILQEKDYELSAAAYGYPHWQVHEGNFWKVCRLLAMA